MDQFTACVGRRDRVLLLDTRSLSSDWLPLPSGVRVAVCNTMMRHELAGSEYNARRADCEAGVQALRRRLPGVRALRDVTLDDLDTIRTDVPERILRRCRFVVAENARVLAAADALREHKLPDFGRLMHRSHAGLRDEYEVSCRELDVMVEQASRQPGVYGARLTGGGFGGSVVALVDSAQADAFSEEAARGYRTATGIDPEIYMLEADDGVREI
jgi:galactokinase